MNPERGVIAYGQSAVTLETQAGLTKWKQMLLAEMKKSRVIRLFSR